MIKGGSTFLPPPPESTAVVFPGSSLHASHSPNFGRCCFYCNSWKNNAGYFFPRTICRALGTLVAVRRDRYFPICYVFFQQFFPLDKLSTIHPHSFRGQKRRYGQEDTFSLLDNSPHVTKFKLFPQEKIDTFLFKIEIFCISPWSILFRLF